MHFDDDYSEQDRPDELAPEGEFLATVINAEEKQLPWARPSMGLFVYLETDDGDRIEDVCHIEEDAGRRRAAVICKTCGIPPRGDVSPSQLIGATVGVEVKHKTASTGRVYAKVTRFFTPPEEPPKQQPKPAAKPAQANGPSGDFPF